MARRRHDDESWASRDAGFALKCLVLLLLGARWITFLYVLAGVLVFVGVRFAVATVRRRRRERAGDEEPFWLHDIRH